MHHIKTKTVATRLTKNTFVFSRHANEEKQFHNGCDTVLLGDDIPKPPPAPPKSQLLTVT